MLERRLYRHIDWLLVGALVLLCAIGITMVYSTTYDPMTGAAGLEVSKQFLALGIGLVAFILMLSVDYRWFSDSSVVIFVGLLTLLGYVLLFGTIGGGARRWIDLGMFDLQPSEFARIVVALALATLFSNRRWGPQTTGGWLMAEIGRAHV